MKNSWCKLAKVNLLALAMGSLSSISVMNAEYSPVEQEKINTWSHTIINLIHQSQGIVSSFLNKAKKHKKDYVGELKVIAENCKAYLWPLQEEAQKISSNSSKELQEVAEITKTILYHMQKQLDAALGIIENSDTATEMILKLKTLEPKPRDVEALSQQLTRLSELLAPADQNIAEQLSLAARVIRAAANGKNSILINGTEVTKAEILAAIFRVKF